MLRALAERYECVAVELGPVVRIVSWFAERRGLTVIDAVAALACLDAAGSLGIDRPGAGDLAASEVQLDGKLPRQQICFGALGAATAAASLNPEAMSWIQAMPIRGD